MKRRAKFPEVVVRAVRQKSGEMLRDMSNCLLAVYDEISRRPFQRCLVRGT